MAQIILITGGTRSGKSEYARLAAEGLTGRRAFVATCVAIDDEMRERIKKHRKSRLNTFWETIEEPLEVPRILQNHPEFQVFLVDCLTFWLNNHFFRARENKQVLSERDVALMADDLIQACSSLKGAAILVSNEVGLGIVPENKDARLFRDLMGICNQTVARAANEVVLVTCGLPLKIKNGGIL